MNERVYNKLFLNKNNAKGSASFLLGYKQDEKEIILAKDTDTYFHIPGFSTALSLVDSDLILNGAVGGPFPAAADRIFKNQENYGNYTPYGTSSVSPPDGMWFCSWLYQNPLTKESQWLDRIYDPGKFNYKKAFSELSVEPVYEPTNTVFYDRPSTFLFESGVMYRYFHLGEKTYEELVATLAGSEKENLLMSLSNWTALSAIDTSNQGLNVKVKTDGTETAVYSENTSANAKNNRILPATINFDNVYSTFALVDYNSSYNPLNEFTWSFWTNSKDWKANSFSQLIGNYSSRGEGISISIEDNSATPYFIVPETHFGHILFLNEKGEGFLDKSVQDSQALTSPSVFVIDNNFHLIVCNIGQLGTIYKMDHTGEIIATTKNYLDEETLFAFLSPDEDAIQMLCDQDNLVYVLTNKAIYTFDDTLRLLKASPISYNDTIAAFSYNTKTKKGVLELVNQVYDVKFTENANNQTIKWSLKKNRVLGLRQQDDGHLYRDNILFQSFADGATNLSVGPDNNLWILHGENSLSIVDPTLPVEQAIVKTLIVGSEPSRTLTRSRKKYINFLNQFDRKTNTREWLCVVYYSDERILYYYNLDGVLTNIVFINSLFDSFVVSKKNQNYENFLFESNGDFTGYEHRRVFRQLAPYNNETQLVLRLGAQDLSKNAVLRRTFKYTSTIEDWENESWKHIVLRLQNKTFSLYVNDEKVIDFILPGNYTLVYDGQPSFTIGSALGNLEGFNTEVQYVSNIFNGRIGGINIYDYAIPESQLIFFLKASINGEPLYWYYPTPQTQYVEQIDKFYKHKLPGAKSAFFNLKLIGTHITDTNTRQIIEEKIKEIIQDIKPSYSELLKINWID